MYQGLSRARNSRFLYVDFNSFFASVEQQYSPELVSKPVAVVSHSGPKGTVLAASYEAKAFGVKTGTRLGEAFLLCPKLITRYTQPTLYRSVHKQFVHILRDMTGPEVKVQSIDEASIPLANNWQTSEQAWTLARLIKARFQKELGEHISCSIGIAPNSLLAKIATNLQKPNGLVEITLENTAQILANMQLTDLTGVAERQAAHLVARGITTPLQFYNTEASMLRQKFGAWGQYWWWYLHGYEPDYRLEFRKSMSHQHVLKRWLTSSQAVLHIVVKMADRLIQRLRDNQFQCRAISLRLSLVDHPALETSQVFDAPLGSYSVLLSRFQELFQSFPQPLPAAVRKITISFYGLAEAQFGYQTDLFNQRPRQESLSKSLETIRGRYGFQSIQLASTLLIPGNVAKEELGFGRVHDKT